MENCTPVKVASSCLGMRSYVFNLFLAVEHDLPKIHETDSSLSIEEPSAIVVVSGIVLRTRFYPACILVAVRQHQITELFEGHTAEHFAVWPFEQHMDVDLVKLMEV